MPILWNKRWNWLNYYDFSLNNLMRLGFNDIRLRFGMSPRNYIKLGVVPMESRSTLYNLTIMDTIAYNSRTKFINLFEVKKPGFCRRLLSLLHAINKEEVKKPGFYRKLLFLLHAINKETRFLKIKFT